MNNGELVFDVINNQIEPTLIFGSFSIDENNLYFNSKIIEVEMKIKEIFDYQIISENSDIEFLESTIFKMLNDGWNHKNNNLDLFIHDFGYILANTLKNDNQFNFIIRNTSFFHNSIYLYKKKIEIFPFHKIYKRLLAKDGENILYFYKSIKEKLG